MRWPVIVLRPTVASGLPPAASFGGACRSSAPASGLIPFLAWRRSPRLRALPVWTYGPLGLVTGFLGLFVGAVGPMVAPFFLRDDFRKEETVATMAVAQAWVHFVKLPAFLALGFSYTPHLGLLAALMACTVAGNWLGTKLLARFSERGFALFFEAVLAAVAVTLIAGVGT